MGVCSPRLVPGAELDGSWSNDMCGDGGDGASVSPQLVAGRAAGTAPEETAVNATLEERAAAEGDEHPDNPERRRPFFGEVGVGGGGGAVDGRCCPWCCSSFCRSCRCWCCCGEPAYRKSRVSIAPRIASLAAKLRLSSSLATIASAGEMALRGDDDCSVPKLPEREMSPMALPLFSSPRSFRKAGCCGRPTGAVNFHSPLRVLASCKLASLGTKAGALTSRGGFTRACDPAVDGRGGSSPCRKVLAVGGC
jgi:hypothetical protein